MNNDSKILKSTPKIYCINFKECDPKKCTSLKLIRFNLIKKIEKVKGPLKKAIILNPFSQRVISVNDRMKILKYGLIVIDCSWKNILNFNSYNLESGRRLPPLIATNPTNYGKWEKLSSAEAIAAALYITKFVEYAKLILSKFSWGDEFLKRNNLIIEKRKKKKSFNPYHP